MITGESKLMSRVTMMADIAGENAQVIQTSIAFEPAMSMKKATAVWGRQKYRTSVKGRTMTQGSNSSCAFPKLRRYLFSPRQTRDIEPHIDHAT